MADDDPNDDNPSDVPWFAPGHQASQLPPKGQPGELLFEFHVAATHRFWRVELRDHGTYRVEAQFFDRPQLRWAQRFWQALDRHEDTARDGDRMG